MKMTIKNGWSSSSLISDVLPEEFEEDDSVLADNEHLRNRVEELEKIVLMQKNEIMLLQASTSDILRRLQIIEEKGSSKLHHDYNSLPRSSGRISASRSSFFVSSSSLPRHYSTSPMSKSLHHNGNGLNNNGNDEKISPRRNSIRTADMINVSVGKSARGSPMRKWVSTQDVKDVPNGSSNQTRRLSTSSDVSTSTPSLSIVHKLRRMSTNRQSSPSLLSICSLISKSSNFSNKFRRNPRICQYSPKSPFLPIFVGGKTLNVPVPTNFENLDPMSDQDPPEVKTSLKHIYSFRGKDVRSNLDILPTGEIVFFSASFVILMMLTENDEENNKKQRIYKEHTCDVKCIAVHPNKILIASGQSSCHNSDKNLKFELTTPVENLNDLEKQFEQENTSAHIRIWDSVKLTTLRIIGGFNILFEKGISQLSFSTWDSGAHLAVVDDSLKHSLSIWNWNRNQRCAEVKAANDVIFECKWHPNIKNLIILYGKGHFSFFHFDESNGILIKTSAVFEGRDKPKTVLSMCFSQNGNVITGDSNGTISIWDPKTCRTIKQAHSVHPGGVYALTIAKSKKLLSGGKDRFISEWEFDDLIRSRRPIELPDDRGIPRIILNTSTSILVGTSTNSLLTGTFEAGFSSIIEGNSGELAEILNCDSTHFVTASKCGTIQKWSRNEKKIEWSKKFMGGIECMDIDPLNTHLLIGFSNGSWQIINMSNQNTIKEHKEDNKSICYVKFAPMNGTFAISTKHPSISIYRLENSRNLINLAKINNIQLSIQLIDWSTDGQYLRTQSNENGSSNLMFWSKEGELVDGATTTTIRNIEWKTQNCWNGFETCLISHSSNGNICSSSKSSDNQLIGIGMMNGTIRLYQNPITSLTAGCIELSGHYKNASRISFSSSSDALLTISSIDNSILEWSLE